MNRQITVRKSWTAFWLWEGALLILCTVICVPFPRIITAAVSFFVILSAIWTLYYYRMKYVCTNGVLKISSGLLFRKHRLLPPENVLWETRLILPPFKRSAMVILHTSGGRVVIFGEYLANG